CAYANQREKRGKRDGSSSSGSNRADGPAACRTRELERVDGRAASAGGVAVRHHMNGNIRLLPPLRRHAGPNLGNERALETVSGLDRPAADNQGVRIEGVHHLVEEQT